MTIQERLLEAEQREAEHVQLYQRALAAAESARDAVLVVRARMDLLKELIAETGDGG